MKLNIKKIQESDAALLKHLAELCPPLDVHTPYTYWVVAKMFDEYSFLLLNDDSPIGYIMCVRNTDCLLVWQIGILEEYRKKGLSRLLIERALHAIDGKTIKQAYVSIAKNNENSFFAFEKCCARNAYAMERVSEINLIDFKDPSFRESETLYRIEKAAS